MGRHRENAANAGEEERSMNMERRYAVTRTEGAPEWSAVPAQRVDVACWGTTYTPETTFQCAYTPGKALYIRMECLEAEPTVRCREQDGPVWKDSCMEAFLAPGREGSYMNLECNSAGALLCCAGSGRHGRLRLAESGLPRPVLVSGRDGGRWEACLEIPAATLSGLWALELMPGARLYANFYKCGDDTPQPHYLSWSPIDLPKPDFHVPQFFGALELL